MGNKIVLVNGDDWEGLFCNGVLLWDDHNINKRDVIECMQKYNTLDVEFKWLNGKGIKWLGDIGNFPKNYSDIPEEYFQ